MVSASPIFEQVGQLPQLLPPTASKLSIETWVLTNKWQWLTT